jgi:Coenzyme PQQ synthesis protein D (PqqD).
MKLKDGFITHDFDGEQIMVAVGAAAGQFHGLVRSNRTAALIIECLKQDNTEEQVVEAVLGRFDASREKVTEDVHKIIVDLKQIGAIHEQHL